MYLARGLRRSAARDVMSEKRLRNAPKLGMHEIATTRPAALHSTSFCILKSLCTSYEIGI